jgi:hypothetical protein
MTDANCPTCLALQAEVARLQEELDEAKRFTTCDACGNRVPYEEPLRLCDTCQAVENDKGEQTVRELDDARAEVARLTQEQKRDAPDRLSERWQELFWALPSGEMRSKLRALEIDIGRMLRRTSPAALASLPQEGKKE